MVHVALRAYLLMGNIKASTGVPLSATSKFSSSVDMPILQLRIMFYAPPPCKQQGL